MEFDFWVNVIKRMDDVFTSPIGIAVVNYLLELPSFSLGIRFFKIKDGLYNNCVSSFDEFYSDFSSTCNDIIEYFGVDSEISLCLAHFLDLFQNAMKPYLSGDSRGCISSLDYLILSLRSIKQQIPDDAYSYERIYRYQPRFSQSGRNIVSDNKFLQEESVDLKFIEDQFSLLTSDEDNYSIASILMKYEGLSPHHSGIINCDLGKCSSYTISLLKHYLLNAKKVF